MKAMTANLWGCIAIGLLLCCPVSEAADYGTPVQDGPVSDRTAGKVVLENTVGVPSVIPFGPSVGFDGQVGDGRGYNGHYYQVDAFLPFHMDPWEDLFFSQLSGGVTEDGDFLGNFGTGYRRYVSSIDRMFTVAMYYDIDDGHTRAYQRASVHASSIGRYWEVHGNGYVIVSDDRNKLFDGFVGDPFFRGHWILINRRKVTEHAFSGGDLQVGGPLPILGQYGVKGYLGSYVLGHRDDETVVGAMAQLQADITNDISIGVKYTTDGTFGDNALVQFSWLFPSLGKRSWFRQRKVKNLLNARVLREDRISTRIHEKIKGTRLLNPKDNEPYIAYHVNPNLTSNGNGSFERPFSLLESARVNNDSIVDIVRVLPREDDTFTNLAVLDTFSLHRNQRLLAASQEHRFMTQLGEFDLPGFVPGGLSPKVTNLSPVPSSVIALHHMSEVSGFLIDGAGIHNGISGADLLDWDINRNTIQNGVDGISLATTSATRGEIRDNVIINNRRHGIYVTSASGTTSLVIGGDTYADGNIIGSNRGNGISANLSGTAVGEFDVSNNFIGGGGSGTIGLSFTGGQGSVLGLNPPDTMGAIGPDHIVEFLNTGFAIYSKADGQLVTSSTLTQFWLNAGVVVPAGDIAFDPRIIFDPATQRWFVTSIDGTVGTGAGNSIYIGVSRTSNPMDGFIGFKILGDSERIRFNDFDMFGIDAEALYISTNNFNGPAGIDNSLYIIPKADLLSPTPTVLNTKRFENLTTVGFSPQPVVDFGPSDGVHTFLGTGLTGGTVLQRTDVTDPTSQNPILNPTTFIPVDPYQTGPGGDQPGFAGIVPDLENVSPRFNGNVVKVGDSIWAVHAVAEPTTGRSAIRYYEIDNASSAVLQTGLIADQNLDFLDASIAVNQQGDVVIGMTGTGEGRFPSSMAVVGRTQGDTTNFGTPFAIQNGAGTWALPGRNRWGDYSATNVDPRNENIFWTFQQYTTGFNTWGINIAEVHVGGGGPNGFDGARFDLSGGAVLRNSRFVNNKIGLNGQNGITINATGSSRAVGTLVRGNNVFRNRGNGLELSATDLATISNTYIIGNTFMGNGLSGTRLYTEDSGVIAPTLLQANAFSANSHGITVEQNANSSTSSLMSVLIGGATTPEGNVIGGNSDNGIALLKSGLGGMYVTIDKNTIDGNATGNGILIKPIDPAGTGLGPFVVNFPPTTNLISNNNVGLHVDVDGFARMQPLTVQGIIFRDNIFAGMLVSQTEDSIVDTLVTQGNFFFNNTEGFKYLRMGDADLVSSVLGQSGLTIRHNLFQGNFDGIDLAGIHGGLLPGFGQGIQDNEEVLEIDVLYNTIAGNIFRGVTMRAEGAAILDVNILFNSIFANGSSGIEARTLTDTNFLLAGGDGGVILGNWTNNFISGNGGHGIAIGRLDALDPDGPGVVPEGYNGGGTANVGLPDLIVGLNTITGNTLDGIHTYLDKDQVFSTIATRFRQSDISLTGNLISGNGESGIDINAVDSIAGLGGNPNSAGGPRGDIVIDQTTIIGNGDDGVSIFGGINGNPNVFIQLTTIESNAGDGVELLTESIATSNLNVNNSVIRFNQQRGVNVLTRGNAVHTVPTAGGGTLTQQFGPGTAALATVRLDNNYIAFNTLEGVYVMNTASPTQDIDALSNTAPLADGQFASATSPTFTNAPGTILVMTNNEVDGNGTPGALGGLVIRVGSVDTNPNFFTGLEFASDNNAGVIARVENNRFSGNIHRDVFIDSFVSTVDPPGPQNMLITPDPKARLDMIFENNQGDSIDVSNFELALGGLTRFYNNADAIKSPGVPTLIRPIFTQTHGQVPGTFVFDPTFRIQVGATGGVNGLGSNNFNLIFGDFVDPFWEIVPMLAIP